MLKGTTLFKEFCTLNSNGLNRTFKPFDQHVWETDAVLPNHC